MATIDILNDEKKKVGTLDLRDEVFATKVNIPLVHQVLKAQLAARRSGNAKTKTRAEVKGTGKKPYKQKGTGNARRGSNRSPLMVGGGTTFGPKPRSYEQRTPKKMVQGALRSALSDRFKADRLMVLDQFEIEQVKTKHVNQLLKRFELEKVLVIDLENENLELSGRNIPGVKILKADGLNVYDIIQHEWLLFTKRAAESVNERLALRD
jgi:large subunit ribosomal protein L4